MIVNAPLIEKVLSIQLKENIQDNKLLILALSLDGVKSTGFKSIKENIYSEEDFYNSIEILKSHGLLTKTDITILDKVYKTKTVLIKSYEDEVLIVVNHMGTLTNTKSRVTDNKKKLIERWLKKGFTVEDLNLVSSYFSYVWNNSDMEKFIREITLYNHKFPERLEEAKKESSRIEEYAKEIEGICKIFEAYFFEYVLSQNKNSNLGMLPSDAECSYSSYLAKTRISFLLNKGFEYSDLLKTMIVTVISWSKNENLREHISIEKIFDDKFEDRLRVAKIKEIPFVTQDTSKDILENWLEKNEVLENNTNETLIENKFKKAEIEEDFIEAEEVEDKFLKSFFKKLKLI